MKRNILISFLVFFVLLIASCRHEHTYSGKWSSDSTKHWHIATCGHDVVVDEAEHSFGEWKVAEEATEESNGSKSRSCTVCGYKESTEIDKLAHTHKYSTIWSSDSTKHWHTSTCGHDVISDEAQHTFGDWTIDIEATEELVGSKSRTCTLCGYKEKVEIAKLTHTHKYDTTTWSSDYTKHWHKATCGHDVVVDEGEHTYGEWKVVKTATEETTGSKSRFCSVCEYEEIAEIGKLPHTHKYDISKWNSNSTKHWHSSTCGHAVTSNEGEHTYGEWVVVEATEESNGSKTRVCTVCGYKEIIEIEKLPHTHIYATTWSSDSTKHWHKATCGHNVKSNESEHTYGEWVVVKEATEETTGSKKRSCNVCGYEESAEIDKLAHTHKYSTTWSSDSTKHWHASSCGHDVMDDEAEHSYDEYNICTICYYDGNFVYILSDDSTSYSVKASSQAKGDIVIPSSYNGKPITKIEDDAFSGCTSVTSIVIPDGLTSIGKYAFSNCTNLTNIFIPDSVISIDNGAFYCCSNLSSVTFGNSIKSIGEMAFYCTSVTNIYFDGSIEDWINIKTGDGQSRPNANEKSYLYLPDKNGNKYSLLTDAVIPDGITEIGAETFANLINLTCVVIPNSVTVIYGQAFFGCKNLSNIYFNGSLEDWVNIRGPIDSRPNMATYEAKLYMLDINGNIEFNGNTYSLLTDAVIPDGITEIIDGTFGHLIDLINVVIPDSVTWIGGGAFIGCSSLTSVAIPSSVTSIGYSSFAGCLSITSIKIPDSITLIEDGAFSTCSSLTSVVIGNGVTYIGAGAFWNCSSLRIVVIPNSVTNIGQSAFDDCTALSEVYYLGTLDEWNSIEISNDNGRLSNNDIFFYSEVEPTDNTYKYWHYIDGIPTLW